MRFKQISLRTILLLIAIFAIVLGALASMVRERTRLRQELRSNPAYWFVTRHQVQGPVSVVVENGVTKTVVRQSSPTYLQWLREKLGDETYAEIHCYTNQPGYDEATTARVQNVYSEANVTVTEMLYPPCHPGCFPNGTLVLTNDEPKAIETLQAGDLVLAVRDNGQSMWVPIASIYRSQNRLVEIKTRGGTLLTTESQPLIRGDGKLCTPNNLQLGDSLQVWKDGTATPSVVESIQLTSTVADVTNLVIGDNCNIVASGFVVRSKPPEK